MTSRQTTIAFRENDVISYTPENTWAREGIAIFKRGHGREVRAMDNFWGGYEDNVVSREELKDAELLFNLDDYDLLSTGTERRSWTDYEVQDRQRITSQHGHIVSLYIRRGAVPSHSAKVAYARTQLEEAQREASSAQSMLRFREDELARIIAGEEY